MQALLIVDAQNEFSSSGKRPVSGFEQAIQAIANWVNKAREKNIPIAWIRHFNKPTESPAFVPGSWGAAYVDGFGPKKGAKGEKEFLKEVYGAFTGSDIGTWLDQFSISEVVILGFYTHGCVSTTSREAIMRGYSVILDPKGTATLELEHPQLGKLTADEVMRSSLLQLVNMGASLYSDRWPLSTEGQNNTIHPDFFVSV
jgi:nicotinamidase-related amidase